LSGLCGTKVSSAPAWSLARCVGAPMLGFCASSWAACALALGHALALLHGAGLLPVPGRLDPARASTRAAGAGWPRPAGVDEDRQSCVGLLVCGLHEQRGPAGPCMAVATCTCAGVEIDLDANVNWCLSFNL
jgi:hypothetical protein